MGPQWCIYRNFYGEPCGKRVDDVNDVYCHAHNVDFEMWVEELTDDRPEND